MSNMWTLIFYISVGWGTAATGGPAVVDNLPSREACVAEGERVKRSIDQTDWYKCIEKVTK